MVGLSTAAGMLFSWLLGATTPIVAPPTPPDGCPTSDEVFDALASHLPGAVRAATTPVSQDQLRLSLTLAVGGLELDVRNAQGETFLRRIIARDAVAPDCRALAEAVAVIVERYLSAIGYEGPPPPLPSSPNAPDSAGRDHGTPRPARPTSVMVDLDGRGIWGFPGVPRAEVRAGPILEHGFGSFRGFLAFEAGLSSSIVTTWPTGRASLTCIPGRLGLGIAHRLGRGRIEGMLAGGIDVLDISSTTGPMQSQSQNRLLRASSVAEVTGAFRIPASTHLSVRVLCALTWAVVRYDVLSGEPVERVIFRTPRFAIAPGVGMGYDF